RGKPCSLAWRVTTSMTARAPFPVTEFSEENVWSRDSRSSMSSSEDGSQEVFREMAHDRDGDRVAHRLVAVIVRAGNLIAVRGTHQPRGFTNAHEPRDKMAVLF